VVEDRPYDFHAGGNAGDEANPKER
jgi:hypothetical protein